MTNIQIVCKAGPAESNETFLPYQISIQLGIFLLIKSGPHAKRN